MTDFVRRFVHHVVHPGPCPPGWAPLAALTLGVIGAALVIIVGAGWMDGRPAKHFGESRSGTFLSASLLFVSAGLCGTIASDRKARRMRWFWLTAAVGFGLLTYDELGMGHEKLSKHVHLALGWDPAQPTQILEVLGLTSNEVLISREVGPPPHPLALDWPGTYRWRIGPISPEDVEGPPSAEGLVCVLDF